jgi:hypothetical protein
MSDTNSQPPQPPAITVAVLRSWLDDFSDDCLVVLSSDGEGNRYSPLSDCSSVFYRAEPRTPWVGETFMDPEARDADGYTEEDYPTPPEDAVGCVVLWPMN